MISIIDHIEYLVTKYDCVIIPNWGAFIAQYSCATISDTTGIISAPKRTLSFNASVNYNDGLLANSIMRREKKSYESSLAIIEKEVSSLKAQLQQNGEVAIGRLGFFTSNEEGTMIFEPFTSNFAWNNFFGLKPLTIYPVSEKEKKSATTSHSKANDIIYLPISRNIFRIAASVILLIGMTFLLSTPVIINNEQEFASLNMLSSNISVAEKINNTNGDLYIAIPINNNDSIKQIEQKAPQQSAKLANTKIATQPQKDIVNSATEQSGNESYYLIVASLHSKELAENHIKKANDPSMKILEVDGKYRIYIASSSSRSELNQVLRKTKSSHTAGAWICHK